MHMLIRHVAYVVALASFALMLGCGPNSSPFQLAEDVTPLHQHTQSGVFMVPPPGFSTAGGFAGFSNGRFGSVAVKFAVEPVEQLVNATLARTTGRKYQRVSPTRDADGEPNGGALIVFREKRRDVMRYRLLVPQLGSAPETLSADGYSTLPLTVQVDAWHVAQLDAYEDEFEKALASFVLAPESPEAVRAMQEYADNQGYRVVGSVEDYGTVGTAYSDIDAGEDLEARSGRLVETFSIAPLPRNTWSQWVESEAKRMAGSSASARGPRATITPKPPFRVYAAGRNDPGQSYRVVLYVDGDDPDAEHLLLRVRASSETAIEETIAWMEGQLFTRVIR